MPPADSLITFALASVVLVVVPGPTVVFVVSRAIAHGRRAALASVAGNSLGVGVLVVAVAVGLGAVVERSVAVYTTIKLLGAAYLIYLGVRTWRDRGSLAGAFRASPAVPGAVPAAPGAVPAVPGAVPVRRLFRQGVLVGVTNPKAMVFFAAVLPQFVDRGAGHVPAQMLVLGFGFVLLAMVLDSIWGLAAGTARDWLARSPRRLAALGGTGGLMMIGLGMGLAVTGRRE
jgi:threonine/homoserine/homoserine lactone efflux protein